MLGLLQGHFPIQERLKKRDGDAVEVIGELDLNSGIAVVIPASKILETLQHPTLVAHRKEMADDYEKKRLRSKDESAATPKDYKHA